MSDISGSGGVDPSARASRMHAREQSAMGRMARFTAVRTNVKNTLRSELSESFNPFQADRETEFKSLKQRRPATARELKTVEGTKVLKVTQAEETAEQFQQRNPEMEKEKLIRLLRHAQDSKKALEILEEAQRLFEDASLVDEALEFLEATTQGEALEAAQEARSQLRSEQEREVVAGRNIGTESREYAEKAGLGKPGDLRDLYRDITGNPREHNALFEELAGQYGYDELQEVIEFLLHSLGADMKAKGPSISRGELHRLASETRVLQSILGVFRFFSGREALLIKLFGQAGLKMPRRLDFEQLARIFMSLIDETYPSTMKILRSASRLGISKETLAQILVFQQFRDAIRQVSPRLYRSLRHRYDLLMAILEALEELEEEYEEEKEREEGEEDGEAKE